LLLKKITLLLFILLIHKGYSINPRIIDTLKIHNQIKLFGLNEDRLNFKSHFFSSIIVMGVKGDSLIIFLG